MRGTSHDQHTGDQPANTAKFHGKFLWRTAILPSGGCSRFYTGKPAFSTSNCPETAQSRSPPTGGRSGGLIGPAGEAYNSDRNLFHVRGPFDVWTDFSPRFVASIRHGAAMDSFRLLTAEEFAAREGEDDFETRWSELVGGRIVSLEPPAPEHGAIVFNFAKAIAKYLQQAQDEKGYAGFETGLVVARNPDTVRRPPVSFFVTGERFAELDSRLTETRPALIVEVASTNDRRRAMRRTGRVVSAMGRPHRLGGRPGGKDTSTSSSPAARRASSPAANPS